MASRFRLNSIALLHLALFAAEGPARAQGVIAAAATDGRVYWASSNAAGAFSGWTQLAGLGGSYTIGIAIGHFGKDPFPDIISGANSGNEATLHLFSGKPGGGFKTARRIGSFTGTAGYLMEMASGDFNEDDVEDVVANTNSNVVAFFMSDGMGGFSSRTEALEQGQGRGMDAGDFNGDGHLDLVRARCCDGMVSLFLGDGTGRFTFARTIGSAGGDPYGLAAADFDGDGNLDILANEGATGDPRFFRGHGDGTFAAWVRPVGADLDNYSAYDAFDYNGDGRADLVGANHTGQRAYFMPGMGNGNFGPAAGINPLSPLPGNLLSVSAMPYADPRAPKAVIDPGQATVAAGSAVRFDASGSLAPLGAITSRDWIWGDGQQSSGAAADHTYAAKGRYWILHRVRADNGLSGSARAVAVVTGVAARAEAGGPYAWGEGRARNGLWTGELDGSGTLNDGGEGARYVWNLMPDLTFAEDFSAPLDAAKWRSGFSTVQDGTLRIGSASGGGWGASHLVSQANFTRRRGMALQTRFQSHGGEAIMFGFKNTAAAAEYSHLQYAFYFHYGSLHIYENGNDRGFFRSVPYDIWHDFKIEIREDGADYWYRPGGNEAWERILTSTFMGTPELKAGISGFSQGYNEFDDIHVGRLEEGRRIVTDFGGPGTFPVILTVTDFLGQSAVDSSVVTTAAGAPPVARTGGPYLFGEESARNGQFVATLDGTGSTDDFGIADYRWEFGDGVSGTGPRPVHAYAGRGPYTLRLTVTDHAGLSHSDQGVVGFQSSNPPTAAFTAPTVVDESMARNGVWAVPFDAGASSDDVGIWRHEWDFGNGTTGTGRSINGSYSAMGTYHPTLTVFDHAGQADSATMTVTVTGNALPVARITAPARVDEDSATDRRWRVAFSPAASTDDFGLWRYEWNFGDGTTSTLAAPVHEYLATGAYNTTLRVFDHAGQSHSVNHPVVVVVNEPPVARFAGAPATAEGRKTIAFDAGASTDDFGISRYEWDFGTRSFSFDGAAVDPLEWIAPVNVTQDGRIRVTGVYSWGPRYFHSTGNYQRLSEMTVRVRTPPSGGAVHAMVGFKNHGSGTYYGHFVHALYFNAGTLGIYENGSFLGSFGSYLPDSEYEARIVTKAAGAEYFVRGPGEADFRLLHASTARTDNPLRPGAVIYAGSWEFDDLAVRARAQGREASAVFDATADPVLTVTDHGGQVGFTTRRITIVQGNPPTASIEAPATYGVGLEVPVSARLSADDYGIALYQWDFGDGSPPAIGERVGHIYSTAGVYTLRLTVNDFAGQTATATQAVSITGTGLVRAVPWRFNGGVEIPHDTWSGKEITLKAVAGTARAPLTYAWDFGDGSPVVTGAAADEAAAYRIEARHAYTGTHGAPFIATITITDASGTRASDTYPVVVKDRTLTVESNVAVDEALWFLHKNQTRILSGTDRLGYWTSYSGMRTNASASAVQAFEINGHAPFGDPALDPYVETVHRGLDFLFTMTEYADIGPQPFGNPDGNGNGIGLTGLEPDQPYQMGAVMDAVIASGAPDALTRTGSVNVKGRRYRDVVQDMADMYAWGQEDAGWARGGWRYSWNGGSDNSAAQWAAIGLVPAEKLWGIRVPAFVKEQNRVWTDFTFSNNAPDCGFGYVTPGHSHELTPSGLVQLAFQGGLGSASQWDCAERRMDREWTAFMNANTTYGFYAFTKAMRLAQPSPVVNLRETGLDWFNADPGGLRRTLVSRQRVDGSWLSTHPYPSEPLINTAWTTIILTPTLFENPPVAVMHASPNPGAVGQAIRFDANPSYHLDPFRRVVSHAWDFDAADGVDWTHPDATGPVAGHAFGSLGSYTVSLRVGDDQNPAHHDVTTLRIDITLPPHPPTSVPGGPYVASVGEQVALDGSGSFDIDQAQGDSITRYGWEVDFQNPRDFDDGLGVRPTGVRFNAAGTFNVGLRVADNTALAFPQAGRPNLAHDAFTTVQVRNRCLDNLQARAKETMVALTWTHDGSSRYIVQRSTAGPSHGFQEIGRTSSTFSTFVDHNVEIGRAYYYRVQSARDCGSYAVSIVPRFRSTNRRPIISTQAVTDAQEGQAFVYAATAADPDGSPLTYFLDQAPAGMAINAGNGVITWIPTQAQVGLHAIAVRVSDGVMSAVQAFILTVAPRANLAPAVTIQGPATAIAGQVLTFTGIGADPEGDTPLGYSWNFGDGGTAVGADASHAFGAGGAFVVTLFVIDARGATGVGTRTVVVEEANRMPIASTGGPYMIPAFDTLTLDGSASSDPDGDAFASLWHFGDNTDPAAGTVVRHVYEAEGTYQASLELRDGRGGIGAATVAVVVTAANHAPVVRISGGGASSNPGEELRFDAAASTDADGDALAFTWDFGDGSGTSGEIVTHVFAAPGRYTVTLTADDQRGRHSTFQTSVHVNAPPVFQAQGPFQVLEDEVFLHIGEAVDADGEALVYSLAQGPSGMSMDPGSGRIFWQPGNEAVGDHAVRVRAGDGRGGIGESAFQLRVVNVNDAPVVTSAPVSSAEELQAYLYGVTASDVDAGDRITFLLVQGPAGMSIDPLSGLVAWTPGHGDVGHQAVVILAVDGNGASDEQSFSLAVTERSWAPEFTSTPPTTALEDAAFQYTAEASDLNAGTVLAFSLQQGPAGMSINPSSGLMAWTPDNTQVGSHGVRIRVSDGALFADQAFTLAVANTNDAPTIVSTAPARTAVGEHYAYQVTALDPDGDALAYTLVQSPAGMTVSPSGLITWPDGDSRPLSSVVEIEVSDSHGGAARQTWAVEIAPDNAPPTVSIRLSANPVAPGRFVTITVDAADNVGVSTRTLSVGGSAVTLSGNQFQYQAAALGEVALAATATDANGNIGHAIGTLRVAGEADDVAPQVSLTYGPADPRVGDLVVFHIGTSDASGIDPERTWLLVDGRYLPVVDGRAEFRAPMRGSFTALATAYDLAGNYGEARVSFSAALAGGDSVPPSADITAPENHAEVVERTAITGTAADADFAYYTLSYREETESEWVEFHRGHVSIREGVLGLFDASLLENAEYQIRLAVFDRSGNQATDAAWIAVDGDGKVGSFSLSFTDLHMPFSGLDLEIVRTYDSRVKTTRDFGVGWSLEVKNRAKVVEKQDPSRGWSINCIRNLFGHCLEWGIGPGHEHEVTVHISGLPKQEFTLRAEASLVYPNGMANGEIHAEPKPGTFTTLTPLSGHVFDFLIDGQLLDVLHEPANPGLYLLTLVDGTTYVVDEAKGSVTRITDPNGNRVDIGSDGISHSDGRRMGILRDAAGRITSVTDGGLRTLEYAYDGHGNLRSVRDPNGNVTRFKYGSGHHLTEIFDARGVRAERTEYDDEGRVVRRINADGDTLKLTHDLDSKAEIVEDFAGRVTTFIYDARGNVLSKQDDAGNTWRYAYDSLDNLIQTVLPGGAQRRSTFDAKGNELTTTDELGHAITRTYNDFGNVLTSTDPLNRTTSFQYDRAGNLVKVTGPDNVVQMELTYDRRGSVTGEKDALGNTTFHVYNAQGRLTQTTDRLGRVARFEYDAAGSLIREVNARGDTARHAFDNNGNRIMTVNALGDTVRTEYNAINKAVREVDARGYATRHAYNNLGYKVAETAADGSVVNRAYDPQGNVASITDPVGRLTRMEYDHENRLTKTAFSDSSSVRNEYDALGRWTKSVDANGNATQYGFDNAGRNTTVTDALGWTTRFEYDEAGRKTAMVDALNQRTEYEYDPNDRLVLTRFEDGTTKTIGYDLAGREVSETDQAGKTTAFEYDPVRNLTAVIDPLNHRTEYSYDANNNRVSQKDANNHVTTMAYDALNRMVSRTYPNGDQERWTYDANGNALSHVKGRDSTAYAFDAMNREVLRLHFPSGHTVRTTYTADGKRDSVIDYRGVTRFVYDNRGQLVAEDMPKGDFIESDYDAQGNRVRMATRFDTTRYTFDALNRMDSVLSQGQATVYRYNAVGNRDSVQNPNGTATGYSYDALNRLTEVRNWGRSGILSRFTYTLNAAGIRTAVDELDGSHVGYSYVDPYRLSGEVRTGSNPYSTSFSYDNVGNRLTQVKDGVTTNYAYNSRDQLESETSAAGTVTYSYDVAGRQTSKTTAAGTMSMDWIDGDCLASVTGPGMNVQYEYDADGRRVSEAAGGQVRQYLIDRLMPFGQVILETEGGGDFVTAYTFGLERISQERGGVTHFYLADGQGSIRQLTDSAGAVTDEHVYSAFGEDVATTGTTQHGFRYTGEYFDDAINLQYNRARWYEASAGRFVSMDAVLGAPRSPVTLNKYLYANANPVNVTDPSGHFGLGEMSAASNISSILTNIQIDIGTNFLDAALNPSAGNGTNFLLLGVAAIGGSAAFKLLGRLSAKFRKACNPYANFSGCTIPKGFDKQHLLGDVRASGKIVGYHLREGGVDIAGWTIQKTGRVKLSNGDEAYEAFVSMNGVSKKAKSTFFPDTWDVTRVENEVQSAYIDYLTRGGKGGKFRGTSASGFEIEGFIDANGIFTTYYPIL